MNDKFFSLPEEKQQRIMYSAKTVTKKVLSAKSP